MNASWPPRAMHVALLVFLLMLLPPLRHALEASMTVQMLVQIPLLIGVGLLLSHAVPARWSAALAGYDCAGVNGLLLATLVAAFWMLPRSLDASITQSAFSAAKYLSIPLLIGLPFGLSWPRMGFVVRGVFMLELIATFFRMGWLYLIWPERLCSNYLLGDQQQLGTYMIAIGVMLSLWIMIKLLWGNMDSVTKSQWPKPPGSGLRP